MGENSLFFKIPEGPQGQNDVGRSSPVDLRAGTIKVRKIMGKTTGRAKLQMRLDLGLPADGALRPARRRAAIRLRVSGWTYTRSSSRSTSSSTATELGST